MRTTRLREGGHVLSEGSLNTSCVYLCIWKPGVLRLFGPLCVMNVCIYVQCVCVCVYIRMYGNIGEMFFFSLTVMNSILE